MIISEVYCYMKLGKLLAGGGERMCYKETCIVCDEQNKKGIHVFHHFICMDCHNNLIQTETNDEKYKFYVDRLKRIGENKIYS
ncbi:inhibitor of sigma-G, Gin family protein [Anoxybacillus flavithermus]|nr:inhibitor of sigma-G, Gin family protein [Anoxybacillus flavithermus]